MIKLCQLKFDLVEGRRGWGQFATFGMLSQQEQWTYKSVHDLNFQLRRDVGYQISLDQSTTNSGIFIKDFNNTEIVMMEFKKDAGVSADDYIFDLEMLLHKVCEGALVTHLIYERPINNENFRSSQVLFQLEGMIRALSKRYSEFKASRLENIANSSWRSVVIMDKFSQHPRKVASQESINTIFPWTQFYGNSLGSDRDIFEAMGVMFGWFLVSFDALGRPYVRGDRFNGNIGGFILPEVSAKELSEEFTKLGFTSEWYMQNPRLSIYENLACAIEKYQVICVELTQSSAMLSLFIECNLKWTNPEKATVVLIAANFIDRRLFEITGDQYHFVL